MSYLGGSGSSASDPYIIDELEDLPPLLTNLTNGINYIAFPEIYDGPKVLDMRFKGWFTNFINMYADNNTGSVNKNVYFNGWTILGMSIREGSFLNFQRKGSNGGGASNFVVRFYDMIIKDMYALASTSETFLFRTDASYGVQLVFYRCKFSVILDAQYLRCGLFVNIVDEEEFHLRNCSINANFITTGTAYSKRITIINDWRRSRYSIYNSIFSLNSKKYHGGRGGNYDEEIFRCANVRFCKFIGNIIVKELYSAGNGMPLISGLSGCVYNVIDIALNITSSASFSIINSFNSGVNLFNTEHITSNAAYSISASNCVQCNDSQMTDASWLTDHSFLVGTPPST